MNPDDPSPPIVSGAWSTLRAYTPARIGLPRSGVSLSSKSVLEMRAAHAAARDAVWAPLDPAALARDLAALGSPAVRISSRAADRRNYLMRPDLGRTLSADSAEKVASIHGVFDLALCLVDGLSPLAVQRHAPSLLVALLPALRGGWRLAPPIVVEQGRVGIGDEVAMGLGAVGVLVLIGERPGLSATDSLGAYITWGVKPALTDANRNCVSNIRPDGIGYEEAARQIAHLLEAARKGGYSGVALKNRANEPLIAKS